MLNLSQILLERTWEKRETPGTALAFFVGKIRSFRVQFEMLYIFECACVCVCVCVSYFAFTGAALYQKRRSSRSLAIYLQTLGSA